MNTSAPKSSPSSSRCPLNTLLFGPGTGTRTGDFGLLILRVGIGLYMAFAHGHSKLYGAHGFGPSEDLIGATDGLGFPMPEVFAWGAGLTEFFGGLLLAIGLMTRPAALGLIGVMAVAIFMVHGDDPWAAKPGESSKELAMLYMLPAIAFVFLGSGRYGLDELLRKRMFCSR